LLLFSSISYVTWIDSERIAANDDGWQQKRRRLHAVAVASRTAAIATIISFDDDRGSVGAAAIVRL
jgi:hypothetical protein